MAFHQTYIVFVAQRAGDQSHVAIGDDVFFAPIRKAGEDSLQDLDWGLDLIRKTGRRVVSVFVYNEDRDTGNRFFAVVTSQTL